MKELFAHESGDHLTMLNVYMAYSSEEAQYNPSQWCFEHYLSQRSLKSADNVRQQLKRIMERNGIELVSIPSDDPEFYTNIQKAITAGYFMQVASKPNGNSRTYTTIKITKKLDYIQAQR